MIEPFIIRAGVAGVVVAVVAGVLGCFVVWRRMAYFGDSISHSALLGAAFGLLLNINFSVAIVAVCALFAVLLAWLRQKKIFAADTLMGIMAHAALSFGVVALSIADKNFDLHAYLFGDILFVAAADLWRIGVGGALALALLAANWQSLVLMTAHEDLAVSEGVNPLRANVLLMLLMALTVAVSIRVVGVLLIGALLVIPAATARPFSSSPLGMACFSALFGVVAVIIGIAASLFWDTPAGPSIVAVSSLLFAFLFPFALSARR